MLRPERLVSSTASVPSSAPIQYETERHVVRPELIERQLAVRRYHAIREVNLRGTKAKVRGEVTILISLFDYVKLLMHQYRFSAL